MVQYSASSHRRAAATAAGAALLLTLASAATATAAPPALAGADGGTVDFFKQQDSEGYWTTGNPRPRSDFNEGDWVNQRVELSDVTAGSHTLVVNYDYLNSIHGAVGYDCITGVAVNGGYAEVVSVDAPCAGPSRTPVNLEEATAEIRIDVPTDGDYTVTFMLHLARSSDYSGVAGASSYPGASLHSSLDSFDGIGVGNRELPISVGPEEIIRPL